MKGHDSLACAGVNEGCLLGQLCHPGKVMSVAIHLDRRWSAGGSSSNSTILEWDSDGHVTAQINTSNAGVCAAGWELSQVVFNLMLAVSVVVSGLPAACAGCV